MIHAWSETIRVYCPSRSTRNKRLSFRLIWMGWNENLRSTHLLNTALYQRGQIYRSEKKRNLTKNDTSIIGGKALCRNFVLNRNVDKVKIFQIGNLSWNLKIISFRASPSPHKRFNVKRFITIAILKFIYQFCKMKIRAQPLNNNQSTTWFI